MLFGLLPQELKYLLLIYGRYFNIAIATSAY